MKNVVIVTPHPDDETLGCGGTILKHVANGDHVYWLIVTSMNDQFSLERRAVRDNEINEVAKKYEFAGKYQLNLEVAQLDVMPKSEIISHISAVFNEIEPNIVYLPYPSDIHSDHKIVFETTIACTKWFRYPFVEKVLVYETLSETDFTIDPDANGFRPNVYVDISELLEKKIEIMSIYQSELSDFPFPRSIRAIESLAYIRGASSGFTAAEAFMLLKERVL